MKLRIEWHVGCIDPDMDSVDHELVSALDYDFGPPHKFKDGVEEAIQLVVDEFQERSEELGVDCTIDQGGNDEFNDFDFPTMMLPEEAEDGEKAARILLGALEKALVQYEKP